MARIDGRRRLIDPCDQVLDRHGRDHMVAEIVNRLPGASAVLRQQPDRPHAANPSPLAEADLATALNHPARHFLPHLARAPGAGKENVLSGWFS
jgi:hypothetical protein